MATDQRIKGLSPTQLGKLAQRLMKRRGKPSAAIASLPAAQRAEGVALSAAQRRMWFLQRLYPDARCYHAPIALRLNGVLDVDALTAALDQLLHRHEILRTRFIERDGEPRQCVTPHQALSLDCVEAGPDAWRAQLLAEVRRPFDLAAGPVWRAKLWRLGEREHVLLMVMHHIVCDGWSIAVMMRELAGVYRAKVAGADFAAESLAIQYGDFAQWQNGRLADPTFVEPLEQHWREALRGIPAQTPLPTSREPAAEPSFAGSFEAVQWPPELLQRCRRYASERGATLYMVLVSAFAALLYRYGSRQDVVIGSPIGNRFPRETEPLIGLFLETVPLRMDVRGEPTFDALLSRVKEASLQAERHRHLPFERIVEALGQQADRRHHPIFQAMLVLENAFDTQLQLSDELSGELLTDIDMQAAAFAWTLVAVEKPDGLWIKLEYQHDLFDQGSARRALQHLRRLLEGALDAPAEPVGALPLLGEDERAALARFNDTGTDYPSELCVHQWFEEIARRYPDNLAVEHPDGALSYAELDRRASRLASLLSSRGVGPDQVVAMCLPRRPILLVALLAILKAGGAWLALDAREPQERLDSMLDECGVKLLLTHPSEHCEVTLEGIERLDVASLDWNALEPPSSSAPAAQPGPDYLAYVIFTSGTTARPKGVLLEHGALLNMALSQINSWGVSPDSRILQFFSPTFDGAVSEIVMALMSGATLVMRSNEQLQPGRPLHETLRDARISMTCLPPSVLAVLPDEPLPELSVLLSGGEACTADLVARWQPGRRFFNAYGPTEVTIGSSTAECFAGKRPTIGTPFANRQMYVLDEQMRVLPVGVIGELYVGGVGIARGYLNRPELTAERFVTDPFRPGGRMYRTGDMGRFIERDGKLVIDFAGRRDNQIKLRGFRIELSAIEAAISDDDVVVDVAVAARGGQLAAFVVPSTEAVSIEQLRARLQEKLPVHMQPHTWTLLSALPLTSNGKVDRRQLLEQREIVRQAERVPPRDALERSLVQIWEALLEADAIGIRDDFFALGGHSLLVAKLMARIEQELGYRVPLAAMFRARTIEQLAQRLRAGEADSGDDIVVPLEEGSGPSLFLVHPVGGNALCYFELASAIREVSEGHVAVYGIQAVASDDYPTTISALAARYVEALRRHQPEGPYALGGWSFGGVVAFEMARLLRAAGEQLLPVMLIDASLQDTWGIEPGVDDALLREYFLLDLQGITAGRQLDEVMALRQLPRPERLARLKQLTAAVELPVERARLEPLMQVFCAHARAFLDHTAREADIDVELYCAREGDVRDAGMWQPLVGGALRTHELDGDHYAILRAPAVEIMATRLVERLSTDSTRRDKNMSTIIEPANSRTKAVEAWRAAIGEDHVLADAASRTRAGTATFPTHGDVVAVLRPGSVEDVQACLAVANQYELPLHPISTGKNWSYGSAVPYADHCALLDLGRMNRVIEHNEKLGYAVVEPGVTQAQLSNYLFRQRSKLMISVTGSGEHTSFTGNTLERGVGVGPYGDRFRHIGGMEVVLADGTVVKTGFGRFKGAKSAGLARWGPGPAVDGLFTQSNLGIVTKLTVWLAKRPEHLQVFVGSIDDDAGLPALVDELQRLMMDGVLRTTFAVWNHYKYLAAMGKYPWDETGGRTPLGPELAHKLIKKAKMGNWNVVGGMYANSSEQAKADRTLVKRGLKAVTDRVLFVDRKMVNIAKRFSGPIHSLFGMDVDDMLDRMYLRSPYFGYPTGAPVAGCYWRKKTPSPEISDMDPDRDRCGVLCMSPAVPFDGEHVARVVEIIERHSAAHHFEPNIALVAVTARHIDVIEMIMYDRDVEGEDERAMACHDAMFAELVEAGYPPYRLGVQSAHLVPASEGYDSLLARIKQAVDPRNVISPGRYPLCRPAAAEAAEADAGEGHADKGANGGG